MRSFYVRNVRKVKSVAKTNKYCFFSHFLNICFNVKVLMYEIDVRQNILSDEKIATMNFASYVKTLRFHFYHPQINRIV